MYCERTLQPLDGPVVESDLSRQGLPAETKSKPPSFLGGDERADAEIGRDNRVSFTPAVEGEVLLLSRGPFGGVDEPARVEESVLAILVSDVCKEACVARRIHYV